MNKLVFVGVLALIIGTAGVLIATGDKENVQLTNSASSQASSAQQQQAEEVLAQYSGDGGSYIHEENSTGLNSDLANAPTAGKKVIFFEGRNCPSCKQLDKNIRSSDVPDGVHIFNVIYEDNLDLAQKYQVRGTPGLYQVNNDGSVVQMLQPVIRLDDILLQLI